MAKVLRIAIAAITAIVLIGLAAPAPSADVQPAYRISDPGDPPDGG